MPQTRRTPKDKDNVIKIPSKRSRAKEKLKAKRMFMLSSVLTFACIAGVMCLLMSSQATLTELTDKASKTTKILKEAESINTQLSVKAKAIQVNKIEDKTYIETVKVGKNDKSKVL